MSLFSSAFRSAAAEAEALGESERDVVGVGAGRREKFGTEGPAGRETVGIDLLIAIVAISTG